MQRNHRQTGGLVFTTAIGSLFLFGATSAVEAQEMTLVNDPASKAVWILRDTDQNRQISSGEVSRFFDATNASGVAAITTHSCLNARRDGLVVVGDTLTGRIVFLRDKNKDFDAQDAGEAWVVAGPGNASGVVLSGPTGAGFDAAGRLYVSNNGSGAAGTGTPDAIYVLQDLDGDGTFMGTGEITAVVGAAFFGAGNGVYSPQELYFTPAGVGFFRNSSAGKHGVYRFASGSGGTTLTATPATFFDAANVDVVGAFTGFALAGDPADVRTVYTLQVATGSLDQIVRLRDANNDMDAQDANEPKVIWQTPESNFTSYDLIVFDDKTFIVSDMTGKKVIALRDKNADGDMSDAGERWDYLVAGTGGVNDLRQMAAYRACIADYNGDGSLDFTDVDDFIGDFEAGRAGADINGDAALDFQDFDELVQAFEGGC